MSHAKNGFLGVFLTLAFTQTASADMIKIGCAPRDLLERGRYSVIFEAMELVAEETGSDGWSLKLGRKTYGPRQSYRVRTILNRDENVSGYEVMAPSPGCCDRTRSLWVFTGLLGDAENAEVQEYTEGGMTGRRRAAGSAMPCEVAVD